MDFEFEASLVYKVSSRTVRATEKPCLEKAKKKKKVGKMTMFYKNTRYKQNKNNCQNGQ